MLDLGRPPQITPPHPGTFIRIETFEEFGLSVLAESRIIDVRCATLSDRLNGNASLSPELAPRVERGSVSARTCSCRFSHGAPHCLPIRNRRHECQVIDEIPI